MPNPLTEEEVASILAELYRRSPQAPTEDEQLAQAIERLNVQEADVEKLIKKEE